MIAQSALVLVFASALQAQTVDSCMESAQTHLEMNRCAADRVEQAEAKLMSLYAQLLARLREDDRPLLVSAQEAWIAYRDKHCRFVSVRSAHHRRATRQILLEAPAMRTTIGGRSRRQWRVRVHALVMRPQLSISTPSILSSSSPSSQSSRWYGSMPARTGLPVTATVIVCSPERIRCICT